MVQHRANVGAGAALPDGTWDLLSHSMEKDLHYTKGTHPVWVLFNEAVQGWNGAIPNASFDMPVGLNNRQNSDRPGKRLLLLPLVGED